MKLDVRGGYVKHVPEICQDPILPRDNCDSVSNILSNLEDMTTMDQLARTSIHTVNPRPHQFRDEVSLADPALITYSVESRPRKRKTRPSGFKRSSCNCARKKLL